MMNNTIKNENVKNPNLNELIKVFANIGLIRFGGPAGQIALMHQQIVEEKKWLSEEEFLHALNFCHFLPGPEAQQLAAYIGWKLKGVLGGFISGILFILPGAFVILGLSILYAIAADINWVQSLFLGLKAAVLAIVAQAFLRISGRALKSNFDRAIAILAFAGLFFFNIPFPYIIFAAGLLSALITIKNPKTEKEVIIKSKNSDKFKESSKATIIWGGLWLVPFIIISSTLGPQNIFWNIAVFFSKLAIVTFGGAYAILSYMAQEVVQIFGWISAADMTNGLGFAETTPGPLIFVTQYVGFLAALKEVSLFSPIIDGIIAAILTTWVTFVPCFLWIFTFAPWIDGLKNSIILKSSLSALTATIVGVIANLSLWFAIHVIFAKVEIFKFGILKFNLPEINSTLWAQFILTILAILLLFKTKITPLKLIIVNVIFGLLIGNFIN